MCNRVLVNMVVMEFGSMVHMSNVHLAMHVLGITCMYFVYIKCLFVILCVQM